MENDKLSRAARNDEFFNKKKRMRTNPSSILILAQSYEGYALLKIVLPVDRYIGDLRRKARQADWAATTEAINRSQEIINDLKEAIDEARRQKGSVAVIQNIADIKAEATGEESVMKDKFSFVIMPQSPEGKDLFTYSVRLDEFLHAYRHNHTNLDVVGNIVSKTIEIMRKLDGYAADLAKLAGESYTAPYPVRNVLFGEKPAIVNAGSAGSEIAQAKEDVSGKKKHKARKDLASEESDNIGPQVTGTEAVAG